MTFTFDTTEPSANSDPSVSQPIMLTNNVSTDGIIAVDHVSFNTANGGQHKQVTFNNKNVPGAQTDPQSTLYTNSGTASSVSQLLYRNQNGIFPVSLLRAWAIFTGSTGAVIGTQSNNVSSIVRNSAGNYSVTITANAVSSASFGVLLSSGMNAAFALVGNYTITGATTFDIKYFDLNGASRDPLAITFSVYQI